MAKEAQKRGVIVTGGALIFGLLFAGALREPARHPSAEAVRRDFLAVTTALEAYRSDHNRYPRGNNFVITQALLGRHSSEQERVYLKLTARQIDDKGRLLDPWGRPYEMTTSEENGIVRIRSAGPDGIWQPEQGGDDIRSWDSPPAGAEPR
jgi:Type II secretion system (T2SS), protein G